MPLRGTGRARTGRAALLVLLLAVVALAGCESAKPQVQVPAQRLYFEGEALADQALYSEAITKFQEVADQNPGTRLGTFAYLMLAELNMKKQDWVQAETNYQLFLTLNSSSHLTSFVLYRLMKAHHENSFTGVFFPTREVDRDMEPNRQIIHEYKRFYFLYPKSMYLKETRHYYREARETLAGHERLVGDFYFNRSEYNAAASRYLYLLRNYPDYHDAKGVLRSLIQAYSLDQQPDLAHEMAQIYRRLYHESPEVAPAAQGPSVAQRRPAPGPGASAKP